MATGMVVTHNFHATDDDKDFEIFCLIWLDANTNAEDNRNTEQDLRSIINRLKKFQDAKECQKYIEERSQHERVVMIVSGTLGREIVPRIHKHRQVISIYVYCFDKTSNKEWADKYGKVKAVVTVLDELISRIQADHKIQKLVEEPLSINVFNNSNDAGKSTGSVNGKFVYYQVLIDCLLRLKSTSEDINELIKYCKDIYEGNRFELSNIREFKNDYSPGKALWWYSRQMFFYKTLNAVLRTENIHMIFLFRKFIDDIQRLLMKHQVDCRVRVYRGQVMSKNELEGLKKCCNQFISVNSFFSTSTSYRQALSFLNIPKDAVDLEPIIFEIIADPKMAGTKPFADISRHSEFPGESEILFMLGSIFRFNSIKRNDNDQVWIVKMTLCNENDSDLKNVLLHMKEQLESEEINLYTLGRLVWNMGRFDLAEKYLHAFLKQISTNDPLLGNLYEDLAKVTSQVGDYDKSVQWRQKSLEFKKSNQTLVSSSTNIKKSIAIKTISFAA
ncbi:unnamed protein product [Rotaria sp. Silwood1]|nr:unnamed protein product [Rotaria sp. Silwood1]CAF1390928.1 unnamed protein product [Rotaria sp. Silwood1]